RLREPHSISTPAAAIDSHSSGRIASRLHLQLLCISLICANLCFFCGPSPVFPTTSPFQPKFPNQTVFLGVQLGYDKHPGLRSALIPPPSSPPSSLQTAAGDSSLQIAVFGWA